ncbi:MAG: transposase [Pirellulaceae bacterium]
MPRSNRIAPGGVIYHVLNRANDRQTIFESDNDYLAFLKIMRMARLKNPMRILAYCLMPNHWHLLLWPEEDDDLSNFMHAITSTHVRRWRTQRGTVGEGHVYQGPYKRFPVQDDEHFYTVCRYVERNALQANLVDRAEDWRFGSLWQRDQQATPRFYPSLAAWPLPRPEGWIEHVNQPQSESELAAIAECIERSIPYGNPEWQKQTAKRMGIELTRRTSGRPKTKRE